MKTSEIFELCHSRYQSLRGHLKQGAGKVQAVALERPSEGYRWHPDRARACEYVADFERIGRHALRRPGWRGRLRLFETYFVAGAEYRRAIQLVGVSEGTFDYWFKEVKRTLGAEYSRTGLFPPSAYFQQRTAKGPHGIQKYGSNPCARTSQSSDGCEERVVTGTGEGAIPCGGASGSAECPL